MNRHRTLLGFCLVLIATTLAPVIAQNQPSGFDRDRGRMMLESIKNDLKRNYYDPAYRGIDIDARFKQADEKIKSATSLGQIFGLSLRL